jgi:hypothetical protein
MTCHRPGSQKVEKARASEEGAGWVLRWKSPQRDPAGKIHDLAASLPLAPLHCFLVHSKTGSPPVFFIL